MDSPKAHKAQDDSRIKTSHQKILSKKALGFFKDRNISHKQTCISHRPKIRNSLYVDQGQTSDIQMSLGKKIDQARLAPERLDDEQSHAILNSLDTIIQAPKSKEQQQEAIKANDQICWGSLKRQLHELENRHESYFIKYKSQCAYASALSIKDEKLKEQAALLILKNPKIQYDIKEALIDHYIDKNNTDTIHEILKISKNQKTQTSLTSDQTLRIIEKLSTHSSFTKSEAIESLIQIIPLLGGNLKETHKKQERALALLKRFASNDKLSLEALTLFCKTQTIHASYRLAAAQLIGRQDTTENYTQQTLRSIPEKEIKAAINVLAFLVQDETIDVNYRRVALDLLTDLPGGKPFSLVDLFEIKTNQAVPKELRDRLPEFKNTPYLKFDSIQFDPKTRKNRRAALHHMLKFLCTYNSVDFRFYQSLRNLTESAENGHDIPPAQQDSGTARIELNEKVKELANISKEAKSQLDNFEQKEKSGEKLTDEELKLKKQLKSQIYILDSRNQPNPAELLTTLNTFFRKILTESKQNDRTVDIRIASVCQYIASLEDNSTAAELLSAMVATAMNCGDAATEGLGMIEMKIRHDLNKENPEIAKSLTMVSIIKRAIQRVAIKQNKGEESLETEKLIKLLLNEFFHLLIKDNDMLHAEIGKTATLLRTLQQVTEELKPNSLLKLLTQNGFANEAAERDQIKNEWRQTEYNKRLENNPNQYEEDDYGEYPELMKEVDQEANLKFSDNNYGITLLHQLGIIPNDLAQEMYNTQK